MPRSPNERKSEGKKNTQRADVRLVTPLPTRLVVGLRQSVKCSKCFVQLVGHHLTTQYSMLVYLGLPNVFGETGF